MPSPENIMALSGLLQSCTVMNADFGIAVKNASKGDFVYFDPPYMPLSKTSYFTGYTHSGFNERDQERLSETCKELSKKGVYVMESNSSTEFVMRIDTVKPIIAMSVQINKNGSSLYRIAA